MEAGGVVTPDQSTPRLQLRKLKFTRGNTIAEDVRQGLFAEPRTLPAKYFYDERGSLLFDRICEVPEYYPTRTEDALLRRFAGEIIRQTNPQTIFELGSGASRKTVHLLDACEQSDCYSNYQPLDVCEEILLHAGTRLTRNYEWLDIEALVGDYTAGLSYIDSRPGPRLYVFLGGSLGNFTHQEALSFLCRAHDSMSPGDFLLLGVDRVKDREVLHAAYNDAEGVTEQFNLNMLSVLNRELDAGFELDRFEHRAFFNEHDSQIEMHLVSTVDQKVAIGALGVDVELARDESIRTEISRKFTPESLEALVSAAGFRVHQHYEPENGFFSLVLLDPRG